MSTRTVAAPGATITYDVRGGPGPAAAVGGVPLLLIGSPMTADGFAALAGHFPDRVVVTYHPRGAGRSPRTDGAAQTEPAEHADDLHRLVGQLGGGPVDVFASSGGAVNALAWVARQPRDVRTLVAHEPPLAQHLPDRAELLAAVDAIRDLYLARGLGPAMAKFIELASLHGPVPAGFAAAPPPDPAAFGLPTGDDGTRDDPLVGQNVHTCCRLELDADAISAAATRVVIGVGEQSGESLAARGARSVADALAVDLVEFPGDHVGFLGGEFGLTGGPEAFAARLREVLPR